MARLRKLPRVQFSLWFVLVWVVPYVAIAAFAWAWKGPHEEEYLNNNARMGILFGLFWVHLLIVAWLRRR